MKREIRLLGIDDASFDKQKDSSVLVLGVFFRGGSFLDGVISCRVEKDGSDATEKLSSIIKQSKFYPQMRAVLLDGIAVGGFNVIDIFELHEKTKIPVIVVIRNYPDYEGIYRALRKIGQSSKIAIIDKVPKPRKIGKLHVQAVGITDAEVAEILKISCTRSSLPEPIRVAHIIGAGIQKGESRGRA